MFILPGSGYVGLGQDGHEAAVLRPRHVSFLQPAENVFFEISRILSVDFADCLIQEIYFYIHFE